MHLYDRYEAMIDGGCMIMAADRAVSYIMQKCTFNLRTSTCLLGKDFNAESEKDVSSFA